jgi:hypothetical protein
MVNVPFASGQSSWTVTSNGTELSLTMTPPDPHVGEQIRFDATASYPGPCCTLMSLAFGDGYHQTETFDALPCPGTSDAPTSVQATFTHTYNQPGKWHLLFSEGTGRCPGPIQSGAALITIAVGDGPSTSQGPQLPTLQLDVSPDPPGPVGGLHAGIFVWARDEDGYISAVLIDWGDGTPVAQSSGDPIPCHLTSAEWPVSSEFHAPQSQPPFIHDYATQGVFTITVTVISTGCDGDDAQHVSGAVVWPTG